MEVYYLYDAVLAFDQRRTAFDPIAAVVISNAAKLPDGGAVDVTTENSVDRKFARVTNDLFLESADEAYRILDPFLSVSAERPVTEAKPAAHEIDRGIEREQKLVANISREREPLHVLHHRVEFVSMNHKHSSPISQTMNRMFLHGDVAIGAVKFAEQLVVVARDINVRVPLRDLRRIF